MMKLEFKSLSPRKSTGPIPGTKPRTRPLGSVRVSSSMDTIPKFPPLTNGKTPRMDPTYEGISGNRMALPPTKVASEPSPSRAELQTKHSERNSAIVRPMTPPRKQSSHSVRSGCGCAHQAELVHREQDLRDAVLREKTLKNQILQLQKLLDELRQQIWEKDKVLEDLQQQFTRQEEHYKELYAKECTKHEGTRQSLQECTYQLERKGEEIEQLSQEYEAKLQHLQSTMDSQLAAERAEKEREVSSRDEKLTKLKKQMAEALKGNSWERQQQLDELSKELQRVQEESELLKMRLKALSKGGGGGGASSRSAAGCSNCDVMRKQVSSAQNMMKEKDGTIVELKTLCTKFERQLNQQDELLTTFAEAKGYKPPQNFKKK